MGWVDVIIILILLFFALEAIGRPLIAEVLDLIGFLLAFLLSFTLYNLPAKVVESELDLPRSFSLVLGFMIIWFTTEIIFAIISRLILSYFPLLGLLKNRFLSIVPALLRGVIFVSFMLIILGTFPIQPKIKKLVNESKLGSLLLEQAQSWERPVKNVFGGATQDSLTFLTIKPKTNERVKLGFQTSDIKIDEATENKMIELVNMERQKRGINQLKLDTKLTAVGRAHSEDMFKRGYFAHYSPEGDSVADRAQKFGVEYLVIGENLAFAPSLELAHRGLMNSEGHRANILTEDFNKIGIGVTDGGIYGLMFVQVFSD